jgi:hypothetical protein
MGACQSHPRDHTWRWLRSAVFQGNTGFFTEQSVELAPVWHPILARFPPTGNYAAILAQVSTPASIVPTKRVRHEQAQTRSCLCCRPHPLRVVLASANVSVRGHLMRSPKPVKAGSVLGYLRRDDRDLLATKPTPYGALVRVMKCREANICLCKFWSWHPTFRQPSGNQPRYLRQRQAR